MNSSFISKFTKPNLLPRIWNRLRSYFFLDQWIVLLGPAKGYKALSWENFKPLLPPLDRFWADPFLWEHEGKTYLFIEELIYEENRGTIACLTLDENMDVLSKQTVLERPYHLSYPFLFEYEGQLYMLPETGKNNGIELYRCRRFPDQWEFVKTLIDNVYAVDATLLERDGKWWLFVNIKEEGGSSWDTLYLYSADRPTSDQWTPHPLNPIVKDIHSARPAGHIFMDNGNLIRPSQDCSIRYGYALNFNRIVTLSQTEYAEEQAHFFAPPHKSRTLAVHTFNELCGLAAIDATQRRRKF